MKKLLLGALLLFSTTNTFSQTLNFTLANPQPNIMEGYGGTFASGDIDGDGDLDLFMTRIAPSTKLYKNDGNGNFTEVTHNFPSSAASQAFFKDLDGDGDLDLFFSGKNELDQKFANIYRNNGSGTFTQVPNALPVFIVQYLTLFDGSRSLGMQSRRNAISGFVIRLLFQIKPP